MISGKIFNCFDVHFECIVIEGMISFLDLSIGKRIYLHEQQSIIDRRINLANFELR